VALVMSQKRQDLELRIAVGQALTALLAAERNSRQGLASAGARMNRRAAAAVAEGARRSGAAWSALRGTPPAPPRSQRVTGILVVVVTVGSAAALVIRQGVRAWRATCPETDHTQRVRPEPPNTPSAASHDTDTAASASELESNTH
jgi:hypothetical protein